ncbi:MAG: glycosyltransferase family 9 protein [Verrucomicrobiota bacterium]
MNFSSSPPHRILLIKPSSMGDVIHALPVVAALHEAWPDAEIRWLIQPAWRDLVEGHPGMTQTISFPRDNFRGFKGWIKSLIWARTLRGWHPHLVIDLQGLLRSALMARCSGAKKIIGLSNAREGAALFYSTIAKVNKKDHAVNQLLAVLDLMGIPKPKVPQFILPQGTLPAGFSVDKPFVVLHPYARGSGKDLTQEQVVAFAESLNSIPVVLVGKGKAMAGLPSNVLDWSQRTTLFELIAIFRQASFIVSSDSGPMHLAAALQPAKTLAIHRWSDPLRVGPWSDESWIWKHGVMKKRKELGEDCREPGTTPTLEEMKMIAEKVLQLY